MFCVVYQYSDCVMRCKFWRLLIEWNGRHVHILDAFDDVAIGIVSNSVLWTYVIVCCKHWMWKYAVVKFRYLSVVPNGCMVLSLIYLFTCCFCAVRLMGMIICVWCANSRFLQWNPSLGITRRSPATSLPSLATRLAWHISCVRLRSLALVSKLCQRKQLHWNVPLRKQLPLFFG